MVSFGVIMVDVFGDHRAQMTLAEQNDVVETVLSDRENESFGEGIQIRAVGRQYQRLHTAVAQQPAERAGVDRVSVENEMSLVSQEAVRGIEHVASDLHDPCAVRLMNDTSDVDPARLEIDGEKTKYRVRPCIVSVSTAKKSAAAMAPQCARRNVRHDICLPRSGAGAMPWARRIRLTVVRARPCPMFFMAPTIRPYPQRGFSRAIVTARARRSMLLAGRPGVRALLPSYFAAMRSRYQRRMVSGVAMEATAASAVRPSALALSPSSRRCASVNRSRLPPSCSRSTWFSARR